MGRIYYFTIKTSCDKELSILSSGDDNLPLDYKNDKNAQFYIKIYDI